MLPDTGLVVCCPKSVVNKSVMFWIALAFFKWQFFKTVVYLRKETCNVCSVGVPPGPGLGTTALKLFFCDLLNFLLPMNYAFNDEAVC